MTKLNLKHYSVPHCYPDKRGYVLTECGIRVKWDTEIEHQDIPSCKKCAEGKEEYNTLGI